MAVTLQVREVRAEIYKSAGGLQGAGAASNKLLGRLFHETFAELVGADERKNFHAALDNAEACLCEWRAALINHAYQKLIGPRLRRHQAELNLTPELALTFWDAAMDLCRWLADLLWQANERGVKLDETLITAEQPLRWELRDEGWTDAVILTGVADAVCRVPDKPDWCVIELKTGRTAPEADLAQACLYHQMLAASGIKTHGVLALLSFQPEKHEQLFSAEKLNQAQQTLHALIGRMAGVLPGATKPSLPPPAPPACQGEYLRLGRQLENAFAEYKADIKANPPVVGPTFLRFPIELGKRVTVKALRQRVEEVQVRLNLDAPPFINNEGGRLSIDLQRPDRKTVLFSEIRAQLPAQDKLLGNAKVPVGVTLDGELKLVDFSEAESAHLLVAGTTGSGKSEWLRAAVAGLLLTNTPDTLRFAFADPKRNAFPLLRRSPFLHGSITYEDTEVPAQLEKLIGEMEARYEWMADVGADTLHDLIRRTGQRLPRIFFICDEYGFLMAGDPKTRKEMERLIKKLGNKARAAGIHLILATQQPSRQVITGPIQTNITARVGLRLPSSIESKMLLAESGAESLLGRGDLLYKSIGDPVRLQSPYLPPDELAQVFGGNVVARRHYLSKI